MLDKFFSIKKEIKGNKTYKIITIIGFKIKFTIKSNNTSNCNLKTDSNTKKLNNIYGDEFINLYEKIKPYTMISINAAYMNYRIINYLIDNNISGDIIECGVWKGGSALLIAETLALRGETNRKIYLYDTFTGMTEPTIKDYCLTHEINAIELYNEMYTTYNFIDGTKGWCEASLESVKKVLKSSNYPFENFVFVKGKVEDTIPQTIPDKISFLRLDTDWYNSTLHELTYLYPNVVLGGLTLSDDYFYWEGARNAIDEYRNTNNIKQLLVKVDDNALWIK